MSFPFLNELLNCTACPLAQGRNRVVVDNGNLKSPIIFMAEAPGEKEDLDGQPLIGRSGKLFNQALQELLGVERKDVFVTNCCQCRPPQNRDPKEIELKECSHWVKEQISYIKPKVIVTLGRFAMYEILKDKSLQISKVHGQAFETNYLDLPITVIPLYHPSACLYRPQLKEEFFQDIKNLSTYFEKKEA